MGRVLPIDCAGSENPAHFVFLDADCGPIFEGEQQGPTLAARIRKMQDSFPC